MELPYIYGVSGDSDDPGIVPMRENTPNVPATNPEFGCIQMKIYLPDADMSRVSSSGYIHDARAAYNSAVHAVNYGRVIDVNVAGEQTWVRQDPFLYAMYIRTKYSLSI